MPINLKLVKRHYRKGYSYYATTKEKKEQKIRKYEERIRGLEAEINAARVKVRYGRRCINCDSDAVVGGLGNQHGQCKVCGYDGSDI